LNLIIPSVNKLKKLVNLKSRQIKEMIQLELLSDIEMLFILIQPLFYYMMKWKHYIN